MSLAELFILSTARRLRRKSGRPRIWRVVTFDSKRVFRRFEFLWPDELQDKFYERMIEAAKDKGDPVPKRPHRPPWWRPFNAFVHCWNRESGSKEGFHDHPRWTVTVLLRGKLIEHTPWRSRTLVPGSIVLRSHRSMHAVEVPQGYSGKSWTLFVCGRRDFRQNTFLVTPQ